MLAERQQPETQTQLKPLNLNPHTTLIFFKYVEERLQGQLELDKKQTKPFPTQKSTSQTPLLKNKPKH